MMRSLFTGLSGLLNHQSRLDVIGNNMANVNTTGFRTGRVNFQTLLSQNIRGAMRSDENRIGAGNPLQVGLGVRLASIDNMMRPGSLLNTNRPLDMGIEGSGFFILQGDPPIGEGALPPGAGGLLRAENMFLSRAGNFMIDAIEDDDGNYFMGHLHLNGRSVMGWDSVLNPATGHYEILPPTSPLGEINFFYGKETFGARATSQLEITGNINIMDQRVVATVNFYDGEGNLRPADMIFTYNHEAGGWFYHFESPDAELELEGGGFIAFDIFGQLIGENNTAEMTVYGAPGVSSLSIDMATLTQLNTISNANSTMLDGNPLGRLREFTVDTDGTIMGHYTNGQSRPLWRIALADIPNPMGLTKASNNLFAPSVNSGGFDQGTGTFATVNPENVTVRSGVLEASNVDMGYEMTSMIITQRGFQSSARMITTSDEMLQVARDLKR